MVATLQSLIMKEKAQVAGNKRYAAAKGKGFTVSECAKNVQADSGSIDIVVHSLANGPEVTKALLETSRKVRALLALCPAWRLPDSWATCWGRRQGAHEECRRGCTLCVHFHAMTGVPGSTS